MNYDIPPYFEDIEPFDEIQYDSLSDLTHEDKTKYSLLTETHRVPETEKFTFLQYPISFFALGIDSSEKVKSAVLIIDDGENGEKMYKDLVTYNGEPDLEFNMEGEAETTDNTLIEGLQLKIHTWHMGRSSMSFSLYPSDKEKDDKLMTRIQLRMIK